MRIGPLRLGPGPSDMYREETEQKKRWMNQPGTRNPEIRQEIYRLGRELEKMEKP